MRLIKLSLLTLLFFLSTALQAEEVSIEHQGTRLLAKLELADGKGVEDGIVLMTHGTIAHGQMEIMASIQTALKEAGVSSIAITLSLSEDQRAGMFECSELHKHKHSDAITEIGLWVDWLKGKGTTDITLLGHSRGGNQTAWYAAEHHDEAIKRVVLIAPGYWSDASQKQAYLKSYDKDLDVELNKARELVKAGKGDTVMQADFLYCKDAQVTAATFVDYYEYKSQFNTPALIKKIPVPVLIIAGSADTTVNDVAGAYRKSLKQGDELHTIEGADHFFRDLYAYDIVDLMMAFMDN